MNNPYSQNFQQYPENNRGRRNDRWDADDYRGFHNWRDDNVNRAKNRPAWDEQQGAYGLQRYSQNSYGDEGYDYRGESPEQQGAPWNQEYQSYGRQEQRSRNFPYRGENQRWAREPSAGRDWQPRSQGYGDQQFGHQPSPGAGTQADFGAYSGQRYGGGQNYGPQQSGDDYGYERSGYQVPRGQGAQAAGSFGTQTNHRGKGPKGYLRTDERIQEEICECLSDDPRIDASEITVEVKDGVVKLEGSVQERGQKHRIEDIADHCNGVKDVHNSLRVTRQVGAQSGDNEKGQEKLTGKSH